MTWPPRVVRPLPSLHAHVPSKTVYLQRKVVSRSGHGIAKRVSDISIRPSKLFTILNFCGYYYGYCNIYKYKY
jgi:hypothetical protein